MARPTKETVAARKKLLEEYSEMFDLLKECGGGLYKQDLAYLLEITLSKLDTILNKCIKLELINKVNVTHKSTTKTVIRLTRIAWTSLGKNRGMCSYQQDTLDFFFYRAFYNKKFGSTNLKTDFIKALEEEFNKEEYENLHKQDVFMECYNRKSIKDNFSKIKDCNSLYIKDHLLCKGFIRVDVHYVTRKIDPKALSELMDLLAGVLEKYAFFIDEDYYQNPNPIRIDFSVVSENKVNQIELCNYIKNHNRNYHHFTKENCQRKNVTMYNTFRFLYKNYINFHTIKQ